MDNAAMRKLLPLLTLATLGIAATLGWLTWQTTVAPARPPLSPALASAVVEPPQPLPAFSLVNEKGQPIGADALKGGWTFLFFGYTHCPDVCPTTLWALQQTFKVLAEKAPARLADSRTLFVSVDPQRDSPEHLRSYINYFNPDFGAATGDRAEVDKLVNHVGAVYLFDGDLSGDSYVVNHSATLYLIDPQGRLAARITPPHEPPAVADTYLAIRDHFSY
jgi:protein SCO1/2